MENNDQFKTIKNKELTKKKLIGAVGELIKTEGFAGLKSASKIAKIAGVDRKLITRYFGGLSQLIEAYVVENDYWLVFANQMKQMLVEKQFEGSEQLVIEILQNQFKFFASQKEMQELILWELSTNNPLMRSIHNTRENLGEKFLEVTDSHFKNGEVNFRALASLLVGGIYYTILHTVYNGGTFTGVDLNSSTGKEDILKTISQIVKWAYKNT